MRELKSDNVEGYKDVCYQIGESLLFYYDVNTERDRYYNAAIWFEDAKSKYPIAGIYCDISECLELINQYNGAKIKQTEKMYEEYEKLWGMITQLKDRADTFESLDSKLQVWNEINEMINLNVAQFLEITSKDELTELLKKIYDESDKVDKSVIQKDIDELKDNISETIKRINSAK